MLFDNPVLLQLKKESQSKNDKPKKGTKIVSKEDPSILTSDYCEGIVKGTAKSFGFLETDTRESFFISPNSMKELLPGDKIGAKIVVENGKNQAIPCELIEPSLNRFIARVCFYKNMLHVTADKLSNKIYIRAKSKLSGVQLKEGDWVVANFQEHMFKNGTQHVADIVEFVATKDDPLIPWKVVLADFDLPKEAIPEPTEYTKNDSSIEREDFTNYCFITIDSQQTKDMDDALYIEEINENQWKLYVAISDPTSYIEKNSIFDKEAKDRMFSIYLPSKNIPMLPFTLSDNLCSLKQGEERDSIIGIIIINKDGSLASDIEFKLSKIKSHGKLVYDEVSDYLEGLNDDYQVSEEIKAQLHLLKEFCLSRFNYRKENYSIFNQKNEYEFVLNDKNELVDINIVSRRIANKIVEEAMILSNNACGLLFNKKGQRGIFNCHLGFDEEKITDVIGLLTEYGYDNLEREHLLSLEGFSRVKRWVNTLNESDMSYIDSRLRKYQLYADTSFESKPHYGLGLQSYATWTSPIRKYGDIINHRIIKSIITQGECTFDYDVETLDSLNQFKKRCRQAERKVKDWLYINYIKQYLGTDKIFKAELFDVSRGGLRFHLIENGATVFVPISMLSDNKDVVECNSLLGTVNVKGNVELRIGSVIEVKIVSIDDESRQIIAAPLEKLY